MHDPYHVYLDLDVINNDYKHNGASPYRRFKEIRSTPFLQGDSSEYFCNIVRLNAQTTNTLPVFIHRIGSPMSPNTTTYTVSLTYHDPDYANGQGFVATAPIIYEPEDKTAKVQPNPTGGQDWSGKYDHVNNYIHFITLVNNALEVGLSSLKIRCRRTTKVYP